MGWRLFWKWEGNGWVHAYLISDLNGDLLTLGTQSEEILEYPNGVVTSVLISRFVVYELEIVRRETFHAR